MSKRTIELPVTAFTFKIITAKYGYPLSITRHTHRELCTYLQLHPIDEDLKMEAQLTEQLHIELPTHIASHISRRNMKSLGCILDQLYKIKLYDYIRIRTIGNDSKETAYGAMKTFYNDHNLTEDDFSFDSAYRGWLRHKKNLRKNIAHFAKNERRKTEDFVTQNTARLQARLEGQKMKSKAVLTAIQKTQYQAPKLFKNELISNLIQIYLYREACGMSFYQIAIKVDKSYSTVREHFNKFDKHLAKHPNLREGIEEVLKYLLKCRINVLLPQRRSA